MSPAIKPNLVAALLSLSFPLLATAQDNREKMHQAIRTGDIVTVIELIKADPTLRDAEHQASGKQPIHLAADVGKTDILGFLIRKGADPNLKDKVGRRPLAYALLQRQEDAVMLLLDEKATLAGKVPAGPDEFGESTTLHLAARGGMERVVAVPLQDQGRRPDRLQVLGTQQMRLAHRMKGIAQAHQPFYVRFVRDQAGNPATHGFPTDDQPISAERLDNLKPRLPQDRLRIRGPSLSGLATLGHVGKLEANHAELAVGEALGEEVHERRVHASAGAMG